MAIEDYKSKPKTNLADSARKDKPARTSKKSSNPAKSDASSARTSTTVSTPRTKSQSGSPPTSVSDYSEVPAQKKPRAASESIVTPKANRTKANKDEKLSIGALHFSELWALAADDAASSQSSANDACGGSLLSLFSGFSGSGPSSTQIMLAASSCWAPRDNDFRDSRALSATGALMALQDVVSRVSGRKSGKFDQYISNIEVLMHDGGTRMLSASTLVSESGKRYYVTHTMHRGGFGKVRYGLDEQGARVAVKMLRMQDSDKVLRPEAKSRTHVTTQSSFDFEVGVMRQLGLVRDIVHDGAKSYVVTPYMQGDGLDLMKTVGSCLASAPLRQTLTLKFLQGWIAGLMPLHQAGIAHRDVKPHNYLYGADGVLHASDFGFAEKVRGITREVTPTAFGTPFYMAPEVLMAAYGRPVALTSATDVWSIGIMALDVLLMGRHPLSRVHSVDDVYDAIVELNEYKEDISIPVGSVASEANTASWRIDVSVIGTIQSPWDIAFEPHRESAPEVIKLILDHLLDANPDTRSSLPMAQERVRILMEAAPKGQRELVDDVWLRGASAYDEDKEEMFSGLAEYAAVIDARR